ncbi:hypothetical protein D3C81_1932570 [compost metagenome]
MVLFDGEYDDGIHAPMFGQHAADHGVIDPVTLVFQFDETAGFHLVGGVQCLRIIREGRHHQRDADIGKQAEVIGQFRRADAGQFGDVHHAP